ncbi:MAG: APC family permease, partial [Ktedonobacterales bacterium]|nr:APC family permease [Ktedonobacterales bacterium]
YGAARLSYTIARDGELPAALERKIWNKPLEGLFITTIATLVVANLFSLTSISTMGSAGFLLIFAAVNAANWRLAGKTDSHRWLSAVALLLCLTALTALVVQTARQAPSHLWVLVALVGLSAGIEFGWRRVTGRRLKLSSRG